MSPTLDLTTSAVDLTVQLVDIESVSRNEQAIADAVEAALAACDHLTVTRHGNTVVARTELGRGERVVIAGHLDTVPVNGNLPARLEDGVLHGLGEVRMPLGTVTLTTADAARGVRPFRRVRADPRGMAGIAPLGIDGSAGDGGGIRPIGSPLREETAAEHQRRRRTKQAVARPPDTRVVHRERHAAFPRRPESQHSNEASDPPAP